MGRTPDSSVGDIAVMSIEMLDGTSQMIGLAATAGIAIHTARTVRAAAPVPTPVETRS